MKQLTVLLLVACFLFGGCKSAQNREKDKQAAKAKEDAQTTEASADVDFQAFIGRLRKAIRSRDVNTLASMMTGDFAYVLGATSAQDRSGDGVFQFWDENGLWPELDGIVSEQFAKKENFMVAPPQFANPALEYDGYRAGVRRVNGSWKFVYFVNG